MVLLLPRSSAPATRRSIHIRRPKNRPRCQRARILRRRAIAPEMPGSSWCRCGRPAAVRSGSRGGARRSPFWSPCHRRSQLNPGFSRFIGIDVFSETTVARARRDRQCWAPVSNEDYSFGACSLSRSGWRQRCLSNGQRSAHLGMPLPARCSGMGQASYVSYPACNAPGAMPRSHLSMCFQGTALEQP